MTWSVVYRRSQGRLQKWKYVPMHVWLVLFRLGSAGPRKIDISVWHLQGDRSNLAGNPRCLLGIFHPPKTEPR